MATFTFTIFICFFIILRITPTISSQTYSGNQGQWRLLQSSIGISAMHMQLLHNNKVIMFDRTDFGASNISLPGGKCREDPNDTALQRDCTAHSVLYDIGQNTFRPLTIQTDPWCSSGAVLPDGTLLQTGGYNDGDRSLRTFSPCNDEKCDWNEEPNYLLTRRWYASNQILPDGRIIIVGGRRQYNYEFYPRGSSSSTIWLEHLRQTRDQRIENNLYPFLHLLPDGNLFIFANTKAILFDYKRNAVVKELPEIPGQDPRNYPSTGSSVLLPLDENQPFLQAEIVVCGGAPRGSFVLAENGTFQKTLGTCGRINMNHANPNWVMEDMPVPRAMGDMLILPNGDVLILNGVGLGTAGWELGRNPVTTPVIYRPSELPGRRFRVMAESNRPRLYHSSAVLVTDGRVLVGGSNPHVGYNFTGVDYPTDLSLEAFSPPYLARDYETVRPRIVSVQENIGYREQFSVAFAVPEYVHSSVVSVTLVAPSFTTHSFAMNQRMVVMKLGKVRELSLDTYEVAVMGPSAEEIAPPGYYLLFVVHADIPSSAMWVKLQ
ncbi:hypothetical protein ACLB2K_057394 [Fragaria x ananassa]